MKKKDAQRLINKKMISDMLYGEDKYIIEFARASIESYEEFEKNYETFLMQRDLENLRRTGHKIKPVALMMNLDQIVDEYEKAKILLADNKSDEDLRKSVDSIHQICNRIIGDFRDMLDEMT